MAEQTTDTPTPRRGLPIFLYIAIGIIGALTLYAAIQGLYSRGRIPVKIVSVQPLGEVDRRTNLTFEFSRDIVDDRTVGEPLDTVAVRFDPELPGRFKWIARRRLRFFPDHPLRPATEYTAEVLSEICGEENTYLEGRTRFRFHTEPFRVTDIHVSFLIEDPKRSNEVNLEATVDFNYDVDPEDLARHLKITHGTLGRSIEYSVETPDVGRTLHLLSQPFPRGEGEAKVSLRISPELTCLGCGRGMREEFVTSAVVGAPENLKLVGIYPRQSERTCWIVVKFSAAVDPVVAKEYIDVEPAVDYRLEGHGNYLDLRGPFQPGDTYTVTVRKGLTARTFAELERELRQSVHIKDFEPTVSFRDKGMYLPLKGDPSVGVETVNIEKIEIEIFRIFENNLVYFLDQGSHYYGPWRRLGKRVHREEVEIAAGRNEQVVTPVDLSPFLTGRWRGVFMIVARDTERRWRHASKWVMATDMGLLAHMAEAELVVWVHSLATLEPYPNAEISLISRTNQLLARGTTDADGAVTFADLTYRDEDFEPYLIRASREDDLSCLKIDDCRMPTSDFDVGGRPHLSKGYEAFLYTDRGVYRPGEAANLAVLVRGRDATVPESFPVKLEVRDPEDRVSEELMGALSDAGACEFRVIFPSYARTGKYRARLILGEDEEIGRTSFSVEEFIPDRVKVEIAPDRTSYRAGEAASAEVVAVNLFGPPAAGRKVGGGCQLEAGPFSPPKYRGYTFGDHERAFERMEIPFGEARLDEQGRHTFSFRLPEDLRPSAALRGVLSATVTESGGRAVSTYTTVEVHSYPTYIGLRRPGEGYAEIGQETTVDFVLVDTEGEETAAEGDLEVTIYKLIWHSILKRDRQGRYRYVSEKSAEEIERYTVSPEGTSGVLRFAPREFGQYRLEVSDPASEANSAVTFYASGWGYAPWSMAHPDRLEIELDKDAYSPGETAQALIRAPFAGKLILCIERERIYAHRVVTMSENTASIALPVAAEHKPNVYITATLIRSTQSLERHAPVRAFGTVPLMVNCEDRRLSVVLDAPQEIRPESTLEVDLQVSGEIRDPCLTIAAVDEGICQLTDFRTPDAFGFFYAKKRLQVDTCDLYTYILPELDRTETQRSTSGDRLRRKHLTPVGVQRIHPVSLWSGIVHLGRDGKGTVSFDLPEFNGSLRLMAVSFDGSRFGGATRNVTVREPIVLTPTCPRFIAPDDRFQVPVSLFNGCGRDGTFSVALAAEGPVKVVGEGTSSLKIPEGKEGTVFFQLRAGSGMGKVAFTVSARGARESAEARVELPLRPAAPRVIRTGDGVLVETAPVALELPSDWIAGTEEYRLTPSAFPAVQFVGSLQYLLRYPYGCLEQTTSSLFPLLYFDDLAETADPDLFRTNPAEYYVEEGIAKLEAMQLSSGLFSFWPNRGEENRWGSIYAAHFLVEARRAGYSVSDRTYRDMLRGLRHIVRGRESDDALATQVYALYVLAAAGKPERSSMIYLKDNKLEAMSPAARFQLAGAFGRIGDRRTAEALLPAQIHPQTVPRETGGTFRSSIRENAIILDVLSEILPDNPSVPVLVKSLTDAAETGRWYTTQENAFAFLALGKILKRKGEDEFAGEVTLNSEPYATFGTENNVLSESTLGGKEIELSIEGKGTCYYYWQAAGIPRDADVEEYDNGIHVRRAYLNRDGDPLDYRRIRQGDLMVAKITMRAPDKNLENVIVADLLPAGLEIENPRLESREDIPWIEERNWTADYMDLRDDRMLLFLDLPGGRTRTFYYALRAVTVGEFILPPITAECMYDPSYTSVASSGMITVVEP